MKFSKLRIGMFTALLIVTSSLTLQAQIPDFDPGTKGPWGEVDKSKKKTTTDWFGIWKTTTWTETRTRTNVECTAIGPLECGGGGTVEAGVKIKLLGGLGEFELKRSYEATEQDPCWLCGIYVCINVEETQVTTFTKVCSVDRPSFCETRDYSRSSYKPDILSAAVKQACDNSQEAKDFCCPGTVMIDELPVDEVIATVEYTDFTIPVDRSGFGPNTIFDPEETDLADVGLMAGVDLGITDDDYFFDGEGVVHFSFTANTVDELSLANRTEIQEALVDRFEELGIDGNILVAFGSSDVEPTIVDLGTFDQLINEDTLYLGNPADINMDGIVDDFDVAIVEEDSMTSLLGARGDVNLDGAVNDDDMSIVLGAMEVFE